MEPVEIPRRLPSKNRQRAFSQSFFNKGQPLQNPKDRGEPHKGNSPGDPQGCPGSRRQPRKRHCGPIDRFGEHVLCSALSWESE